MLVIPEGLGCTRTLHFAKEGFKSITFEPYIWKGRKAGSLDIKKN
jgi:hypothetical protein